jgi:uncharacterized protein YbjT (DUF2867 family)
VVADIRCSGSTGTRREEARVQVVVIGGTGLIGGRLVEILRGRGHTVVVAAPRTGVDTISGAGLAQAMDGADVVVDVVNSPSFEPGPVLEFFRTSTRNILAAETSAGVHHHIALSIVGCDRAPTSGYLKAKVAQEALIQGSVVPFTILRSTQFFEFGAAIAKDAIQDGSARLTPATLQPIAAADVSAALALLVERPAQNMTLDLAGPERIPLARFAERVLRARGDQTPVVDDPQVPYFGAVIDDDTLTPAGEYLSGTTHLDDWLRAQPEKRPPASPEVPAPP